VATGENATATVAGSIRPGTDGASGGQATQDDQPQNDESVQHYYVTNSGSEMEDALPPRKRTRKAAPSFDDRLLTAVDKVAASMAGQGDRERSDIADAIKHIRGNFSKQAQVWAAVLFTEKKEVASVHLELDEDVRGAYLAEMLKRPLEDLLL
jgi:hypothetical protein